MENRKCSTCSEVLTEENCAVRVFKKGTGRCRKCLVSYQNQWNKDNPGKQKIYKRNRRSARPEEIRAYDNGYYHSVLKTDPKFKAMKAAQHRKSEFGMTNDVFEILLASQDSRCAICNIEFDNSVGTGTRARTLCVDHCHVTNKIRGLLCGSCNKGLGLFFDSPEIMLSAITYIKKHSRIVTNSHL